jgi:amino acid adenylation domain-containing protein
MHAGATPKATAIVAGSRRVSYDELHQWSTQLAHMLIRHGCAPGDRVCLLMPKSVEAIVGMFGVLKAGCIYVPMDTKSPAARLTKILEACSPSIVLAYRSGDILDQLRASGASSIPVGWLSDIPSGETKVAFSWRDLATESAEPLPPLVSPHGPAHILFTSGSTGVPKGVVITHSNVMRFLLWAHRYFGAGPDDRHSCHPPLHFDLSTFDIFGTFFAGAELHLVPDQTSLLPRTLVDFIRNSELTQWFSVPSALKFMAQFDAVRQDDFPKLRRLLWCGEALPTPTLQYWMRKLPHVEFTNLYGPTEATIASSYYTVPQIPRNETEPISIGAACEGEQLMVLDGELRPVKDGETGDLYIAGDGLSPGYWNDPEKTAQAFVTSPTGQRIYKTGDLARTGSDGLLYLLGRSDSQIKSRGYRIELGEIESALHTLGEVRECAVVAIDSEDFDGKTICCAYVSETKIEPARLRERLSKLVPPYMLPARWMQFDKLPLNGNGKIDRPRVREQFREVAVTA